MGVRNNKLRDKFSWKARRQDGVALIAGQSAPLEATRRGEASANLTGAAARLPARSLASLALWSRERGRPFGWASEAGLGWPSLRHATQNALHTNICRLSARPDYGQHWRVNESSSLEVGAGQRD